jgi:hypothetical protein
METTNVIQAFSVNHVVRVTGLSKRQIAYWDQTEFFSPRHADAVHSAYNRIYSFQDVVGLRVISILRKDYKIPLQKLRAIAKKLSEHRKHPWSEITLYVFGKEVHFCEPTTGKIRGVMSEQYVNLQLRSVIDDVAERANRLRDRTRDQYGKIARHRFTAHNAWVVAGTRIPVAAIHRFKEAGYGIEKIIREYPALTKADVLAALKHDLNKKTAA